MTLLFQSGDPGTPGTHALVVGVGNYPWIEALGLGLSATVPASCRSAVRFQRWLIQSYRNGAAPLASVRSLLSLPPGHDLAEAEVEGIEEASSANFLAECSEWATALSSHPENVGILLFTGHGMGLGFDRRVIALSDVGRYQIAPFQGSVSLNNLYAGMAPSERWPQVARTQFYFIDACAAPSPIPSHLEHNASHIFAIPFPTMADDRVAPLFFSASAGGNAYAKPKGLTFFVDSLLGCLDGEGAEPASRYGNPNRSSWVITSLSLPHAMEARARLLSEQYGVEVRFSTEGLIRGAVLHELEGVPQVRVLVHIGPQPGAPARRLDVAGQEGVTATLLPAIGEQGGDYTVELAAGFYQLKLGNGGKEGSERNLSLLAFPPEVRADL